MRSSVSDPPIPPAQLSQPACRSGALAPSENRLAPASRRTDAKRCAVRGGGVSSGTMTTVSGLVRSSRRRPTMAGPAVGGGAGCRNRLRRDGGLDGWESIPHPGTVRSPFWARSLLRETVQTAQGREALRTASAAGGKLAMRSQAIPDARYGQLGRVLHAIRAFHYQGRQRPARGPRRVKPRPRDVSIWAAPMHNRGARQPGAAPSSGSAIRAEIWPTRGFRNGSLSMSPPRKPPRPRRPRRPRPPRKPRKPRRSRRLRRPPKRSSATGG
jgi:hypothetical protein